MRYTIPYEVPAETAFAAIIKATGLLRNGVIVEHVRKVGPTVPGWYECVLDVAENEYECDGHIPHCPGPLGGDHIIDHPADATAFEL